MEATNDNIGRWAGRRNRYAARWHRVESIYLEKYLMKCGRLMAPETASEGDPLMFTDDADQFGVGVTCKRCRR